MATFTCKIRDDESEAKEYTIITKNQPYHQYTLDEKGYIERVDEAGGDMYGVIYRKDDYLKAKQSGKVNKFGNPEPSYSMRVYDKKTLPLFTLYRPDFIHQEVNGAGQFVAPYSIDYPLDSKKVYHHIMVKGHYSFSDKKDEAINLFKWLASNSIVEWAMLINKQGRAWIGTRHEGSVAVRPYNLPFSFFQWHNDREAYYKKTKEGQKILRKCPKGAYHSLEQTPTSLIVEGFEEENRAEDWHSHYGTGKCDFYPSNLNDGRDGDVGATRSAKKRGLTIKFIMYSPLRPDIQEINYTNY